MVRASSSGLKCIGSIGTVVETREKVEGVDLQQATAASICLERQ